MEFVYGQGIIKIDVRVFVIDPNNLSLAICVSSADVYKEKSGNIVEQIQIIIPLLLSILTAIGTGVAFIAARRERNAIVDNIEEEARKKIFSSYGDLVTSLEKRLDNMERDLVLLEKELDAERHRRRTLQAELDVERAIRKQTEAELIKIASRLAALEEENSELRKLKVRVTAVEEENRSLKRENEVLRETIAEWKNGGE